MVMARAPTLFRVGGALLTNKRAISVMALYVGHITNMHKWATDALADSEHVRARMGQK